MFPCNGNYLILHLLSCINIINSSRFSRKHFPPKYFFLAESFTPIILSGFHFILSIEPFDHNSSSSTFMHLTRNKVFTILTSKSLKIKIFNKLNLSSRFHAYNYIYFINDVPLILVMHKFQKEYTQKNPCLRRTSLGFLSKIFLQDSCLVIPINPYLEVILCNICKEHIFPNFS